MAPPRSEEEQLEKVLVRHERPYFQSGGGVPKTLHPVTVPLIACLIAVACAGGLWYAYRVFHGAISSPGGGEPPLIRADQTPTKVKPDATANSAAPDSDKDVYNMGQTTPTTEKLLPPPEQPLAKPVPSVAPSVLPVPTPPPAPVTHAPAVIAPTNPAVAQSMPSPVVAPLPQPVSAKPVPPPVAAANQAGPPPTAAAPARADKPASGDAGFRLQVAATKDEGAAQSEWARLKKAHADLLGDLSLTVVRADLGEKGVFYRLQAGVIPDRAAAEKLCEQLRAVSIGCILVKAQ